MKVQKFPQISGLKLSQNLRIENGEDSFVIPFPSTNPFNIVFHGEDEFSYGHYGVHLGQEDRLTFLGNSNQKFKAYFIDCRMGSPTKGNRLEAELSPSSEWCLCIPPGVAHAFDGLEDIHTINSYRLFLPNPENWLTGKTDWNIENDVINLPMEISDAELQYFTPNSCKASNVFYELIRQHQKENIPKIDYEYPSTEDIEFEDGTKHKVMIKKKTNRKVEFQEWEPIEGIFGLGWQRHLCLWSGENSGFIPFLEESAFYIVDHGVNPYNHDAFGIHLGQEDRLTFVSSDIQKVFVELVDCREDSPTFHKKISFEFNPTPLRFLVIPNGVAHRFERLEKVYTINRPRIFSDDEMNYDSGNDVIDWDIQNEHYPSFKVSKKPASKSFYELQSQSQKEFLSSPLNHSTPIVLMTKDNEGNDVRVALRKKS